MKIRIEFDTYESKLATLVSMLQSGVIGLIVFWLFFNVPSFVVLICGVEGYITGILFGVMSFVALVSFLLFVLFVKPEKIDEYFCKRTGTTAATSVADLLPETRKFMATEYYNSIIPLSEDLQAKDVLEQKRDIILRDMIDYLMTEEKKHIVANFYFDNTEIYRKIRSLAAQFCVAIALYHFFVVSDIVEDKVQATYLIRSVFIEESKVENSFFETDSYTECKLALFQKIKEKNKRIIK